MGYYLEVPRTTQKDVQLQKLYNATRIHRPDKLSEIPGDKALICVVVNPFFDAAAYCYSDDELRVFSDPEDSRSKTWLLMEKGKVEELTGYRK